MKNIIIQELADENSNSTGKATIESSPLGITVSLEGLQHCTGDDAIFVELRDGKLMVHVWADPDMEDPTHSIEVRSK